MKIISQKINLSQLEKMASNYFGNMVKAVVDIEQKIMAVDAELHANQEKLLLEQGSKQVNLWGINIYPKEKNNNWIEFDSMINLRPHDNNQTRGVDSPKIRKKIITIVNSLIQP